MDRRQEETQIYVNRFLKNEYDFCESDQKCEASH